MSFSWTLAPSYLCYTRLNLNQTNCYFSVSMFSAPWHRPVHSFDSCARIWYISECYAALHIVHISQQAKRCTIESLAAFLVSKHKKNRWQLKRKKVISLKLHFCNRLIRYCNSSAEKQLEWANGHSRFQYILTFSTSYIHLSLFCLYLVHFFINSS